MKHIFTVAFALVFLFGCTTSPSSSRPRMLVIAVDGVEWNLVLRLVREGRLPEFEKLMKEGTFGAIETLVPTRSPVIWTSIATGKPPEKHGILKWALTDPESPDGVRLYSNSERMTKAFWNILGDHDRRAHMIGWFVTFPVEPISGVMVAQANTTKPEQWVAGEAIAKGELQENLPRQVYPPERQDEMIGLLRQTSEKVPALLDRIFGSNREELSPQALSLIEACHLAFRADLTYLAIAKRLAKESPPFDLMAVYVGGTDVVAHRFWRYLEPTRYTDPPSDRDRDHLEDVIFRYYEIIDREIGALRKQAGDGVATVVLSDHGMGPYRTNTGFPPEARGRDLLSGHHKDGPPGVFLAAGAGIRRSSIELSAEATREEIPRLGHVYDIAPTLLAYFGIPIGEDMDGRVIEGLFDEAWQAAHPIRTVRTHDTPEWLASRPKAYVEDEELQERMEQLRSLGYVDG